MKSITTRFALKYTLGEIRVKRIILRQYGHNDHSAQTFFAFADIRFAR